MAESVSTGSCRIFAPGWVLPPPCRALPTAKFAIRSRVEHACSAVGIYPVPPRNAACSTLRLRCLLCRRFPRRTPSPCQAAPDRRLRQIRDIVLSPGPLAAAICASSPFLTAPPVAASGRVACMHRRPCLASPFPDLREELLRPTARAKRRRSTVCPIVCWVMILQSTMKQLRTEICLRVAHDCAVSS